MASSHLSLHYHIIFGTKDRIPFIHDSWISRLHEYIGGTVRGLDGIPQAVGGVADHVHLLVGLKATHCLSDFVRDLKNLRPLGCAMRFQGARNSRGKMVMLHSA
jgi:putative transposase